MDAGRHLCSALSHGVAAKVLVWTVGCMSVWHCANIEGFVHSEEARVCLPCLKFHEIYSLKENVKLF